LSLPESLSGLLEKLIGSDDDYLIAYQISFDLVDKEQQSFTTAVLNHISARSE